MFCGMPVGGGLSALTTQLLPPDFDWRTLFQLGGVWPILLIPARYWLKAETLVRAGANPRPGTNVAQALFGHPQALVQFVDTGGVDDSGEVRSGKIT